MGSIDLKCAPTFWHSLYLCRKRTLLLRLKVTITLLSGVYYLVNRKYIMKYLKTQPGIFKIVESLLMIVCFFCGVDYLAKGNNEAKFVAGNSLMIIFFVINVFFILLHCTFRWSCSCLLSVKNCIVKIIYDGVNKEFVHAIVASIVCAVATILYLIVAVGCSNGDEDETGFSECWTYYLESVFAFCATLMFIIDASFLNAEREEKCNGYCC